MKKTLKTDLNEVALNIVKCNGTENFISTKSRAGIQEEGNKVGREVTRNGRKLEAPGQQGIMS